MKKIIIGIIVIIFLIPLSYVIYEYTLTESYLKECDDIVLNLRREVAVRWDNNNFPEFAKDFLFLDDFDRKSSSYNSSTIKMPEYKEEMLYDSKLQEQYSKDISEIVPKDFSAIKQKFAPGILKKMKEEKKDDYLSPEESKTALLRPTNRLLSRTVEYWCACSFQLNKNGDYNTSLLLPLGAFYLIREAELFYGNCSHFEYIVTTQSNKMASLAILAWASQPHFESKELSKKVALDILDLVKHDCSITRYIEFYKYFVDSAFGRLSFINSLIGKDFHESSHYKDRVNYLINKPLDFEKEPYYEIKDEYERYSKEAKSYASDFTNDSSYNPLPDYLFNREKIIIHSVFAESYFHESLINERRHVEEYLSYMEFSAVALLINSYYCYNKRLPKTIEDLEEWCGKKLPTNRIDNTPYDIDTKGEHTLTYKNVKKAYYSYEKRKPLYFDFQR